MNAQKRSKMVNAMEYIAQQINDDDVFEDWLISGVADGDIDCGYMEDYMEDASFADLMHTFLRCMKKAYESGGLYCDNVVSKAE